MLQSSCCFCARMSGGKSAAGVVSGSRSSLLRCSVRRSPASRQMPKRGEGGEAVRKTREASSGAGFIVKHSRMDAPASRRMPKHGEGGEAVRKTREASSGAEFFVKHSRADAPTSRRMPKRGERGESSAMIPQAKKLVCKGVLHRPTIVQLREARRLAKARLPVRIIPFFSERNKRRGENLFFSPNKAFLTLSPNCFV